MQKSPPSKVENKNADSDETTDYTSIMLQRYQKKVSESAVTDQEDIKNESNLVSKKAKPRDKYSQANPEYSQSSYLRMRHQEESY